MNNFTFFVNWSEIGIHKYMFSVCVLFPRYFKNDRASGVDGMTTELLKAAGTPVLKAL